MTTTNPTRIEREARLRWVPIAKMKVNPMTQRELKQYRVDALVADLDVEQIGNPTVNERDGEYHILDGQHRVEALRQIGWGDQQIQCWAYAGLTEDEEAEKFLQLNNSLSVDAFAKFKVGVTAGRPDECDIDRIVRAAGCTVSRGKGNGQIAAVSTLQKIYERGGPSTLSRTIRLVTTTYGDAGLDASVLDGIGLLVQRYGSQIDDERFVPKLGKALGGCNGLLNKARVLKNQLGGPLSHCVAAAAVEIYNSGRGGKKLPGWWGSTD